MVQLNPFRFVGEKKYSSICQKKVLGKFRSNGKRSCCDCLRRPVGTVGRASDYRAGGRGFKTPAGPTNDDDDGDGNENVISKYNFSFL